MTEDEWTEAVAKSPWRFGNKLGRTIYATHPDNYGKPLHDPEYDMALDVFLGIMETRTLALLVCNAHNMSLGEEEGYVMTAYDPDTGEVVADNVKIVPPGSGVN